MRTTLVVALATLSLAACDSRSEPVPEPATGEAPATTETAPPPPAPETTPAVQPTAIPAALHGRWGLTAADCEPGRPDATGLLTVTTNKLEFYESVGTLGGIEEGSENRIRANFDFTGEGMSWERDMTLDLQDGGQTLIRREYGEDAASGPIRYSRC